MPLPPPATADGPGALLDRRRSTRRFAAAPLPLDDLAALLWAAAGHRADGGRTIPSAHALHPLSVTVVAGAVDALPAGAHRYDPAGHALHPLAAGDHRRDVARTTLADEEWLPSAPALLLLGADVGEVVGHFADQPPPGRGERYVWIETGCAVQNVHLAAAGRGLGAVVVGGFRDDLLHAVLTGLGVPAAQRPLAVLSVGLPGPAG